MLGFLSFNCGHFRVMMSEAERFGERGPNFHPLSDTEIAGARNV